MIIILQDNDEAGRLGASSIAESIQNEFGEVPMIGKWNEDLPKGFDPRDDKGLVETNKALENATPYKPKTKVEEKLHFRKDVFTIMMDKEASEKTPEPMEWIVENVLPKEQNSVLAGTTGSKKSYYVMQLGMCLASGGSHFIGNRIMANDFKVLYVDTEIGQKELLRRYHRLKKHLDWKDEGNWCMMSKSGRTVDIWDSVHYVIQNQFMPDLLIIDSLYNSTTITALDKSTNVSKLTDELCEFKDRYGTTMLTVGHFNKGGNEMGLVLERMNGASQLQNWVEWDILMCKTNVPNLNLWRLGKTRATAHDESYIALKWEDFWFKPLENGVVDDPSWLLLSEQKKENWKIVLEDLPDRFDTNQWLNVFDSKFSNMAKRTGENWLKSASATPMLNKIAHGVYEKGQGLLTVDNVEELLVRE
jgi:hypothetical protein